MIDIVCSQKHLADHPFEGVVTFANFNGLGNFVLSNFCWVCKINEERLRAWS